MRLQDVAQKAGASLSSVSRVLNHYPGIHPELRARVEQAMRELGYVLPSGRQRLKPGRQLIYFLLTNRELHIAPHAKIFQAIEREAGRKGDLRLYKSFRFTP